MPKRESKAKPWLEDIQVKCQNCGQEITVTIEIGAQPPKHKICDGCHEEAGKTDHIDPPEDWDMVLDDEAPSGRPRKLTMEEVAILSKSGAITPLLPGALMCPAFGIFCMVLDLEDSGNGKI